LMDNANIVYLVVKSYNYDVNVTNMKSMDAIAMLLRVKS